ncbi:Zn-finger protein [Ceratobasidium sp. AG-Ba]|nr:Zn-finger protein [Ceratobasidium sp. AG-Ba]
MYKHARNWVEDLLGTKEFNRRFMVMPGAQDLRHFKKGVTGVKVWTGRESRDMMRQFLPIIVDAKAPPDFVRLVRNLLDFSYIAHSARLSDVELTKMDEMLQAFHKAKSVLLDRRDKRLGIMKGDEGFDRIAKLHMLGHYTQDIRQFGTPDGYSTETPEHLHIMYVKIPWRMSNRRNPLPQMVGYTRRLEALEIQRAQIEECYGKDIEFDIRDVVFEDEAIDSQSEDDEAVDNGDELEDLVQITLAEQNKSEYVFYPQPRTSIARRPTAPDVPARVIVSSYGASNFIRALHRFLWSKTTQPDKVPLLLPTDRFPLWHKAVLEHARLPFAPTEPCHRDVVRVQPPVWDAAGRQLKAGIFDMALFATNLSSSGVSRFRAGRVRAIFSLPLDLAHLFPEPLAYVDLFTPLLPDTTSTHKLYAMMLDRNARDPLGLVLPLSSLRLACHLTPDFSLRSARVQLRGSSTTFGMDHRFLLNEHYNHYTFLVIDHWRRIVP